MHSDDEEALVCSFWSQCLSYKSCSSDYFYQKALLFFIFGLEVTALCIFSASSRPWSPKEDYEGGNRKKLRLDI